MKSKLKFLALLPLAAIVLIAAGCGTHTVTTTADEMGCVYGAANKGQHLIAQIPASSNAQQFSNKDTIVFLPASNRFYMAAKDSGIRDPRAPEFYLGYAAGSVPVDIQGQIRFRFNPARACEWYAKHGRRNADANGDLGFNVRGAGQADTGWERWLAENFGVTMQQAVQEILGRYQWPALVYNYPDNANANGVVKGKPGALSRIQLGDALGTQFTKDLNENLGGNFFCGIADQNKCQPMEFQVVDVTTQDPSLMTARAQVEKLRAAQQNADAQLQIGNQQLRTAEQQQQILGAQVKADALQAQDAIYQAEIKNANCIVLAKEGLDCKGNRPGGNVTVTSGK